jgi:hypothetical protein
VLAARIVTAIQHRFGRAWQSTFLPFAVRELARPESKVRQKEQACDTQDDAL